MRPLLKNYSISKTGNASFTLKFETTKDVVVVFDNDLNTISLSEGDSTTTSYTQNYETVNGKLKIAFRQNFGGGDPITNDPVIDIDDQDLPA